VQPVDDGLGQHLKIYVGQEENDWLEDDDNMSKWENNELTASDRRILLGTWYCAAYRRALTGPAKRKYFEHTGALLTADGTGDDLIQLEGVPKGHTFSWVDDEVSVVGPLLQMLPDEALVPEPDDVCPPGIDSMAMAPVDAEDDGVLDEDDDSDEEDAPPAPCLAPAGFYIVDIAVISSEQLLFSKEASLADDLVGMWILYKWPVVGWCVGIIKARNALLPTYHLPTTSYLLVPPTTYHLLPPTSYLLLRTAYLLPPTS
jgi:hypothetical protein